jgi:filamentous hemagglutinin family protein
MNKLFPAFRLKPLALAVLALGLCPGQPAVAAPQDGAVAAGTATITQQGLATTIQQSSDRAIINWRGFSIGADELVRFIQPSARSATLNRVTGAQMSSLLGPIEANGQVFLINPNGILIGAGARIDVGSLIATTSNLEDRDFVAGRLQFTQPGKPGAGIVNAGHITAAEGGLVALVAPNVRNDGIIEARLGNVLIGAADTFTLDLYGDGLLNLALGEQHRGALHGADGQPVDYLVSQSGQIHTDGGKTVLITAANAGAVLDKLINMQGTIRADTVASENGRIVLSGAGGAVDVSGQIAAIGDNGGHIEVLGGAVHLTSSALLDASGTKGGGVVHVGGDWQGGGHTPRARTTRIDEGAAINVRAVGNGDGGEAVVWSDGHTAFAGQIDARGGESGGNGGRVEVSGKQTLDFAGLVDAGAALGLGGSLLLDPAIMNIGLTEAALINHVLRLGASTTVSASSDINVNSLIDGRGGRAGGGLSLIAGNNININETIVTNNGAVTLTATNGTVNFRTTTSTDPYSFWTKQIFSGSAPITITTGGNLSTGVAPPSGLVFNMGALSSTPSADAVKSFIGDAVSPWVTLVTTGKLTLVSTRGNVTIDAPIPQTTGAVEIRAGNKVVVNEKLVNAIDAPISITAGTACAPGTCNVATQGTITVNESMTDTALTVHYELGGLQTAPHHAAPEVDARNADLTITAFGNIDLVEDVASLNTIRITSTKGSILKASVGVSRDINGNRHDPYALYLDSALDMGTRASPIFIGTASVIDLRSSQSIYSSVYSTWLLNVVAGVNAEISGRLGSDASITTNHGDLSVSATKAGALYLDSGGDIKLPFVDGLSVEAIAAGNVGGGDTFTNSINSFIWLTGGGLSVTAGNDILFAGAKIRILGSSDGLTLKANQDVKLGLLQTNGAVSIESGHMIALNSAIGAYPAPGVASLWLLTPDTGSITMEGARAVGQVTISTGTLNSNKAITGASRDITATIGSVSADAMTPQSPIDPPPDNGGPGIPPGPSSVSAPIPPFMSGDLAEIPLVQETLVPASTRSTATNEESSGAVEGGAVSAENDSIPLPTTSIAQWFDFGRSGSFGPEPPPGSEEGDEERTRRR